MATSTSSEEYNVKVNSLHLMVGRNEEEKQETINYDIVLKVEKDGTMRGLKLLVPNVTEELKSGVDVAVEEDSTTRKE